MSELRRQAAGCECGEGGVAGQKIGSLDILAIPLKNSDAPDALPVERRVRWPAAVSATPWKAPRGGQRTDFSRMTALCRIWRCGCYRPELAFLGLSGAILGSRRIPARKQMAEGEGPGSILLSSRRDESVEPNRQSVTIRPILRPCRRARRSQCSYTTSGDTINVRNGKAGGGRGLGVKPSLRRHARSREKLASRRGWM